MASKQGKSWIPDALRIALVGKTGSGKSSTGNTILGRKEFCAMANGQSVTKNCSKAECDVDGRRVAVVDTPGLFDTTLSNEEITRETSKSIILLAPGPHAFLLVLQIGRFTEEERSAVEHIRRLFGKEADKYIMIVFTRGDDLEYEKRSIEDYLQNTDAALKKLISDCGHRFHVFNNRNKDRTQVKELLQKIDDMVMMNGGSFYTNKELREAAAAIQKEKERIAKKREEERKREAENRLRLFQQEMEKKIQREKQRQEEENRQMEKKLREKEEQLERERRLREKAARDRRELMWCPICNSMQVGPHYL